MRVWDTLVQRLEGRVEMGIHTVDIVDTISGLRFLMLYRLVPVVKTILACNFEAIADSTWI